MAEDSPAAASGESGSPAESSAPLLREPADGVPDPIATAADLARAAAALAAGSGPIAVDAERASGYRYSQRAYLVQLRRAGTGTVLIDPLPIGIRGFGPLADVVNETEWILHAAPQDLPCLAELGLRPARLFDTELAGRLLGDERVALGTMVEQWLHVRLGKEHSAADWSTRPLPREWLAYAALDVELLIPLHEVLAGQLADAGKVEWAAEEFEAIRASPPAAPRDDPWRRTSGLHAIRTRRELAIVRSLWYARDAWAAERDISPGRLLPDSAIIAAARANPSGPAELAQLPTFRGPRQRRAISRWWNAVAEALVLPEADLPQPVSRADAMPPTSRWRERDPKAAARLAACRHVISTLAATHRVLPQNLLAGDIVRRLAWEPPDPPDATGVSITLATHGARPWQIGLTASRLGDALTKARAADPTA